MIAPETIRPELKELTSDLNQTNQILNNIDSIPNIHDFIGYWDGDFNRVKLDQVLAQIRRDYGKFTSKIDTFMLALNSLSVIQEHNTKHLLNKQIISIRYIQQALTLLKGIECTLIELSKVNELYKQISSKLQENGNVIDEKLKILEDEIIKGEQADRNLLSTQIAIVITFMYGSTAFGNSLPPNLVSSLLVAFNIAKSGGSFASIVKKGVDSLKIADIESTIAALKKNRASFTVTVTPITSVLNSYAVIASKIKAIQEKVSEFILVLSGNKELNVITEVDGKKAIDVWNGIIQITNQYLNEK